jgi:hypothetical protein
VHVFCSASAVKIYSSFKIKGALQNSAKRQYALHKIGGWEHMKMLVWLLHHCIAWTFPK